MIFYAPNTPSRQDIVKFVKFASCIKGVEGIGDYHDIEEDHINLQQNIARSGIEPGDKVVVRGIAIKYMSNNEINYCIVPDSVSLLTD